MEDKISSLDYKVGYSNLTKGERDAVYVLENFSSVIDKEADKGYANASWDREDHLKEAKNHLDDKNAYKELTGNVLLRNS